VLDIREALPTACGMIRTHAFVAMLTLSGSVLPMPAHAAKPKSQPKPVLTCKVQGTDGFSYTVVKAGKGAKPGADAKVEVNYSGRLKSDGSEFDSGQGTKFKVGQVIPGFAQGLQLMQPGGKYRLCIPAKLGYGEAGAGGDIPPNADLVFEVELLSFKTPPPKPVVPAEARSCDLKTASGLDYAIARQGTGRSPTDSDITLVDMMTFDPANGTILMREEWEKIPMVRAAPPFSDGLKLMQVGASYRFCFPASEGPQGQSIPALNVVVDMIDVRPAPVEEED
jgi:FKBP-type peptidyl-prolyl cis-trans isomerase